MGNKSIFKEFFGACLGVVLVAIFFTIASDIFSIASLIFISAFTLYFVFGISLGFIAKEFKNYLTGFTGSFAIGIIGCYYYYALLSTASFLNFEFIVSSLLISICSVITILFFNKILFKKVFFKLFIHLLIFVTLIYISGSMFLFLIKCRKFLFIF